MSAYTESKHGKHLDGPRPEKTGKQNVFRANVCSIECVSIDPHSRKRRRGINPRRGIHKGVTGHVIVIDVEVGRGEGAAIPTLGARLVKLISSPLILASKVDSPPIGGPSEIVNDRRVGNRLLPLRDGGDRSDDARLRWWTWSRAQESFNVR
jgi:hypothetical protein